MWQEVAYIHVPICVQSEDNLWEVLSLYHVDSWARIQLASLLGKCLYPLSCLADHCLFIILNEHFKYNFVIIASFQRSPRCLHHGLDAS